MVCPSAEGVWECGGDGIVVGSSPDALWRRRFAWCGARGCTARGRGGHSHVAEMACIGSLHASASPAAVHRLRRMALCSWLRTARVVYYAALTPLFLPLPSLWFLPSLLLFFSFSLLPSPPSIPSLDYCNLLFLVRVPRRYGSQPGHEFVTDFNS